MDRLRHGMYLLFEKLLHWCISPYLRAKVIKLLGGSIGDNVRVCEIKLFNTVNGFKNLLIEKDVYIGTDAIFDLADKIIIRKGAAIGQRVIILTSQDPGSSHNSPICKIYPPKTNPVEIGSYAWIGASSTILPGIKIGDQSVIGANSLVNKNVPERMLAVGNPVRTIKKLAL